MRHAHFKKLPYKLLLYESGCDLCTLVHVLIEIKENC